MDEHYVPARCIATTGTLFTEPIRSNIDGFDTGQQSNCFRTAKWSADGTTIVTYNEDLKYRSFVLPPDLLEPNERPHALMPYSKTTSSQKSYAFDVFPYYDLTSPNTTLIVAAQDNLPIRLTNALDLDYNHATYPWVNVLREEWLSPYSLSFFSEGTRFVAGAIERIAIFDTSRSNEGPLLEVQTRRAKKARKYGEIDLGLAGLVSSLAVNKVDRILAAGTTLRQVGLWADEGAGSHIASFSLGGHDTDGEATVKGNGVSQMIWSPCGRYLLIAERQSDVLLIYDIRVTGKRLGWLRGRHATTTQKLGFSIKTDTDGALNVWAGGTDGKVRLWRDVISIEGPMDAADSSIASTETVSNVMVHPSVAIVATTSGQRCEPYDSLEPGDVASSQTTFDNRLNVWTV